MGQGAPSHSEEKCHVESARGIMEGGLGMAWEEERTWTPLDTVDTITGTSL